MELNSTSVEPNAMDLALVAVAALDAGIDRDTVITAVGGLSSRLTRLVTIARRAGPYVRDLLRYNNCGEAGALILVEGAGSGPDAADIQSEAHRILEEEARWASSAGGISRRLTGADKGRDIEVEAFAEGLWTASRAACEAAVARAAERMGKKSRRVENRKPALAVVEAAPVAVEAPAAPVEAAAPVVETPAAAPVAVQPVGPAATPVPAPAADAAAPVAVAPVRREGKAPVAKAPTLDARIAAASARALAVSQKRATDREKGALAFSRVMLAHLATGKRPEGEDHEAWGGLLAALFPTDA